MSQSTPDYVLMTPRVFYLWSLALLHKSAIVMETVEIKHDLKVAGLQLQHFPEGISELFDELMSRLPGDYDRSYYGISHMNKDGEMIYRAAAETLKPDEAQQLKLNEYTIEGGRYLCVKLLDWRKNLQKINSIFGDILKDPRTDHQKPCIEWYKNEQEMLCMVKMK